MLSRTCLIAGFAFLGVSIVLIPLGTELQTRSPLFPAYEAHLIAELTDANSGKAPGRAMLFAFAWPFAFFFCMFIATLFTGGIAAVLALARWRRDLAIAAAGAFGMGCFVGWVLGLHEAIHNLRWGLVVLAMGSFCSAAGLAFGAIGTMVGALWNPHAQTR